MHMDPPSLGKVWMESHNLHTFKVLPIQMVAGHIFQKPANLCVDQIPRKCERQKMNPTELSEVVLQLLVKPICALVPIPPVRPTKDFCEPGPHFLSQRFELRHVWPNGCLCLQAPTPCQLVPRFHPRQYLPQITLSTW